MTRKQAIAALQAAGFHEDKARWARVYVESRIAYAPAQAAWQQGARLKAAGFKCSCFECKAKG